MSKRSPNPNRNKRIPPPKKNAAKSNTDVITHSLVENKQENKYLIWLKRFWGFVTALAGLFGFTIFNILPDSELTILDSTDQSRLVFKLTNKSWIPMKGIKPYLYVKKIETLDGLKIDSLIIVNHSDTLERLTSKGGYSFSYNIQEGYFNFKRDFFLAESDFAIVVKYKYFTTDKCEAFFFTGKPNYHGKYIWTDAPEQDYVEAIDRLKPKRTADDMPMVKYLEEMHRQGKIDSVAMPPLPEEFKNR